jgi:hypothetical protein
MEGKVKILENRTTNCRTWNMAKNTEKREKCGTYTLGPGVW